MQLFSNLDYFSKNAHISVFISQPDGRALLNIVLKMVRWKAVCRMSDFNKYLYLCRFLAVYTLI